MSGFSSGSRQDETAQNLTVSHCHWAPISIVALISLSGMSWTVTGTMAG